MNPSARTAWFLAGPPVTKSMRAGPRWKTPAHTGLLAIAEGSDERYVIDSDATADGLRASVRGEMTLTERRSGSMVFAASSVSWCGALPQSRNNERGWPYHDRSVAAFRTIAAVAVRHVGPHRSVSTIHERAISTSA
jgi:hypothetical protein